MAKQVIYLLLHPIVILASALFYIQPATGKSPAGDAAKVQVMIRPTYNGAPLKTSTQYYVNALGDTFYIDAFRFYISNVSFTGFNDHPWSNNHLFDIADTATYSYLISAPNGRYSYIYAIIGVDSIANTSGANEGDLDPVKGMYWAWNSGYIMAKLEGHSKVCNTLHHAFEFHIGGYLPPYNAARRTTLSIMQHVEVSRQAMAIVILDVDVAKWLGDIDLAKTNSVLIPGKEAMMIADKYIHMFSVAGISYQAVPPQ